MQLYCAGVNFESMVDGEGVRVALFLSGCLHNCPGCHNPETHDFTYGFPLTEERVAWINAEIKKRPFLRGLTLSGGDPFYRPREALALLENLVIPHGSVWIYSGFLCEEILADPEKRALLAACEVLVDGPFLKEKRNPSLRFRGSENQRILKVSEILKK